LLTSTRDELQNATQHLNTLSAEFGNMKCLQDEYTGLLFLLFCHNKYSVNSIIYSGIIKRDEGNIIPIEIFILCDLCSKRFLYKP